MKKKISITTLIFILIIGTTTSSKSQTTITLQPGADEGKDAFIDSRVGTSNYGNHQDIASIAWTNSGDETICRGLLEFDFSKIPSNVIITGATLSLYNNPGSPNNNGEHSSLSGSNESVLQRITSDWNEESVTWNNQPTTTNHNEVILSQSASSDQDYSNIDVTALVQDMIANPDSSFGFMLRLQTEEYYRCMIFASSDNENPELHPKLIISYIESDNMLITLQPGADEGKDAFIDSRVGTSNYGNHQDIASIAWTNSGDETICRGLLEFDFSKIPSNVIITGATLSLYNNPGSPNNNGEHSSLSGSNESVLQRITSDWNEESVTWNNQPTTTNHNEVILSQSASSDQDYSNIDVTALVQDMIANPDSSFGFMLRLQTEEYYRCMIFASSDNENPKLHPKLDIYYKTISSVLSYSSLKNCISLYPNPTDRFVSINIKDREKDNLILVITDLKGQIIHKKELMVENGAIIEKIDVSNYSSGIYFVSVQNSNSIEVKKMIIN